MMDGIDLEEVFYAEYSDHPDLFVSTKGKAHDVHHMEWLNVQSTNNWINSVKQYLVRHDFVIDQ